MEKGILRIEFEVSNADSFRNAIEELIKKYTGKDHGAIVLTNLELNSEHDEAEMQHEEEWEELDPEIGKLRENKWRLGG